MTYDTGAVAREGPLSGSAVLLCDVWDAHWSRSAAERSGAPRSDLGRSDDRVQERRCPCPTAEGQPAEASTSCAWCRET